MHLRAPLFQPLCPSWTWVLRESEGTGAVPDLLWHKGSPTALGLNPVGSERRWCWVPWPGSRRTMLGTGTAAGGTAGHHRREGGDCIL